MYIETRQALDGILFPISTKNETEQSETQLSKMAQENEAAETIQEAVRAIFSFYQKGNQQFIEDGNKQYIQPDSHELLSLMGSFYSEKLYSGFGINKKEHRYNPKKELQKRLCDVVYFTKYEDQIYYDQQSWRWFCNPFYSETKMVQRKNNQKSLIAKIEKILKKNIEQWNYESYEVYTNLKDNTHRKFIPSEVEIETSDALFLFYKENNSKSIEKLIISEDISEEIDEKNNLDFYDFEIIL